MTFEEHTEEVGLPASRIDHVATWLELNLGVGLTAFSCAISPVAVARGNPTSSLAWATLAEQALEGGRDVEAYAYARTGYHRGLDALRRSGWKGHGPVPWAHVPNRGFLRSLAALARAAAEIDEIDEAERCRSFLADSSQEAATELL